MRKSTTPLNASAPCSVEPAPCSTSIESIASSGIGQIEIVMRGLAVVDAEAIQQHQGLLEGSSAQNQIRLSAARAALFQKDRGILAQQLLRRLQRERFVFNRQHHHRSGRLRQSLRFQAVAGERHEERVACPRRCQDASPAHNTVRWCGPSAAK